MDLHWIDAQLAVAARPRGDDWLGDEMAALKSQGVDLLVSCLTAAEERELELADEEREATAHGLSFARCRMQDRGTPVDTHAFEDTVNRIIEARDSGGRAAIHCRQGLGRAPLVAAAVLVRSGMGADDAWRLISERRGRHVPDTEEQAEWLRSYARRGEAAAFAQGW